MNLEEWKEREKIYACWLCNFPCIGNRQIHQLSELCGGPEGVYFTGREQWEKVLSPKQVQSLKEYTALWRPELEYHRMTEEGIGLLTMADKEYPERLREIPDPPFGLFVRGKQPESDCPAVAVIGARDCSEYGKYVAGQLGGYLGRKGVRVISGMARGIDGIAQNAAMEAGGYSVGVLGSGVDVCYPAQNRPIYKKLIETGAILSPYPLGTPARPQNFPPRNRIVSGLADAVVVVEARVKSGTLITVDMALEQGKEVYVVPGRVTDRLSDGCNRLLRQGAGVLLSPESFLEEIWQLWEVKRGHSQELVESKKDSSGKKSRRSKKARQSEEVLKLSPPFLTPELTEIWEALDFYPKSMEEIGRSLGGKYPDIQITMDLMRLCMENLAVQVSPGHFSRLTTFHSCEE